MKKTIAIVGANGRVGSEVSLLLSMSGRIAVAPVVRSEYAGSYLRRLGLPVRIGSARDPDAAREVFRGVDLIVDFSLPGGLPSRVKRSIRDNIGGVFTHAPGGAAYVFISSTAAFGVDKSGMYRDYRIARSAYATEKRYGEERAVKLGAKKGRAVSVLRLGEVHGDIQPVSHQLKTSLPTRSGAVVALPGEGRLPSDVVFCSTIASTLIELAMGRLTHGAYTVVEDPQWSLRQLYEHFAQARGVELKFADAGVAGQSGGITSGLRQVVTENREFLTARLLPEYEPVELRLRSPYYVRSAAGQIAASVDSQHHRPSHRFGAIAGRRPVIAADVVEEMRASAHDLRQRIVERIGVEGTVFPLS